MKCDICKKRDAIFHMQEQSPTGVRQVSLCLECALTKGLNIRPEDVERLFSSFISNIFTSGTSSSANIANQTAARILNLKCNSCGKSLEAITASKELGCPDCLTYFSSFADAILFSLNHSLDYKGNLPEELKKQRNYKIEIFNLKKQLKQSVSMEDFHKAAEIRDKIKELQSSKNIEDNAGKE